MPVLENLKTTGYPLLLFTNRVLIFLNKKINLRLNNY
jgi:hypothetical protein